MSKITLHLLAALFLFQGVLPAQTTFNSPGGVRAAADGAGQVTLVWFPPKGVWPKGGFRIEDQQGRVLLAQVRPFAEAGGMEGLSPQDRNLLERLKEDPGLLYRSGAPSDNDKVLLVLRVILNPALNRHLGLSCTLKDLPKGRQGYRVVGLDDRGQRTHLVMTCPPLDAHAASPGAPAPQAFMARVTARGVELSWKREGGAEDLVMSYLLERQVEGSDFVPVAENGILAAPAEGQDGRERSYLDDQVVQEREVVYRLVGVDLFGRHSQPALTRLRVPRFANRVPPEGLKIQEEKEGVRLFWEESGHAPGTRYFVERSPLTQGPYQVLTPQGVVRSEEGFLDRDAVGKGHLYYRLRTVASDGQSSHPSAAVLARPGLKTPPPAQVGAVVAKLGLEGLQLNWHALANPPAGYLVERLVGAEWQRVNEDLWGETVYTYPLEGEEDLSLSLRVRAVGPNSQIGAPSAPVVVRLRPRPRQEPRVALLKQREEGVEIRFEYPVAGKKLHYLVRRSDSPHSEGMVISPPLDADRPFVDRKVGAGRTYCYRVQVIGSENWLGACSQPASITVESLPLSPPPPPRVERVEKPFRHIRLALPRIPANLHLIVERRGEGDRYWQTLSTQCVDTLYVDANPPPGPLEYRLRLADGNDLRSEPSTSVPAAP